jgi:accessory gene regulator protein AgrB
MNIIKNIAKCNIKDSIVRPLTSIPKTIADNFTTNEFALNLWAVVAAPIFGNCLAKCTAPQIKSPATIIAAKESNPTTKGFFLLLLVVCVCARAIRIYFQPPFNSAYKMLI